MKYDPDKHHRQSQRLKGHDYAAAGAYFITLCTHNHQCLFGEIADGQMHLNELGEIVSVEWQKSPQIRQEIELDEWVVMPNHLHGIVWIQPPNPHTVGAHGRAPLPPIPNRDQPSGIAHRKPKSISSLIAGFKSATTKRINIHRSAPGTPLWQRNYYDHIIRNDTALHNIQHYIHTNPQRWAVDQLHPDAPTRQ